MTRKHEERLQTLLQTDAPLWAQGICFAGMDEAGRGPLAGNVVAACVIMPPKPPAGMGGRQQEALPCPAGQGV